MSHLVSLQSYAINQREQMLGFALPHLPSNARSESIWVTLHAGPLPILKIPLPIPLFSLTHFGIGLPT